MRNKKIKSKRKFEELIKNILNEQIVKSEKPLSIKDIEKRLDEIDRRFIN